MFRLESIRISSNPWGLGTMWRIFLFQLKLNLKNWTYCGANFVSTFKLKHFDLTKTIFLSETFNWNILINLRTIQFWILKQFGLTETSKWTETFWFNWNQFFLKQFYWTETFFIQVKIVLLQLKHRVSSEKNPVLMLQKYFQNVSAETLLRNDL